MDIRYCAGTCVVMPLTKFLVWIHVWLVGSIMFAIMIFTIHNAFPISNGLLMMQHLRDFNLLLIDIQFTDAQGLRSLYDSYEVIQFGSLSAY